jgi:hypothetical protein
MAKKSGRRFSISRNFLPSRWPGANLPAVEAPPGVGVFPEAARACLAALGTWVFHLDPVRRCAGAISPVLVSKPVPPNQIHRLSGTGPVRSRHESSPGGDFGGAGGNAGLRSLDPKARANPDCLIKIDHRPFRWRSISGMSLLDSTGLFDENRPGMTVYRSINASNSSAIRIYSFKIRS